MVIGDDDPAAVGRTLESMGGQTSRRWSLTAVTPQGRLDEVRALVRSATSLWDRRRCRVLGSSVDSSVRDLLREGLDATRGSPRALIFPGDLWAPDAVALLSAALTPGGVVYADEDEVGSDGAAHAPRF